MKWILGINLTVISLSCGMPILFAEYTTRQRDFQEENIEDDNRTWSGPGWYYGRWFNKEEDYDTWRRNHYYQRNQRNRSNDEQRGSYDRHDRHSGTQE